MSWCLLPAKSRHYVSLQGQHLRRRSELSSTLSITISLPVFGVFFAAPFLLYLFFAALGFWKFALFYVSLFFICLFSKFPLPPPLFRLRLLHYLPSFSFSVFCFRLPLSYHVFSSTSALLCFAFIFCFICALSGVFRRSQFSTSRSWFFDIARLPASSFSYLFTILPSLPFALFPFLQFPALRLLHLVLFTSCPPAPIFFWFPPFESSLFSFQFCLPLPPIIRLHASPSSSLSVYLSSPPPLFLSLPLCLPSPSSSSPPYFVPFISLLASPSSNFNASIWYHASRRRT